MLHILGLLVLFLMPAIVLFTLALVGVPETPADDVPSDPVVLGDGATPRARPGD